MLAELEILPVGQPGASVSALLAKAAQIIDASGLDYRLGAMGTVVEGTWDQIIHVAHQCHAAMLQDVDRVLTTIKIDDRKDQPGPGRLTQKIASLEAKVGHPLKT